MEFPWELVYLRRERKVYPRRGINEENTGFYAFLLHFLRIFFLGNTVLERACRPLTSRSAGRQAPACTRYAAEAAVSGAAAKASLLYWFPARASSTSRRGRSRGPVACLGAKRPAFRVSSRPFPPINPQGSRPAIPPAAGTNRDDRALDVCAQNTQGRGWPLRSIVYPFPCSVDSRKSPSSGYCPHSFTISCMACHSRSISATSLNWVRQRSRF